MTYLGISEIDQRVLSWVGNAYKSLENVLETQVSLNDFSVGLLCLLVLAAAYKWHRRWVKRRGFRMILKDRNDKIHALLLDILGDGIEDAIEKRKISNKEANDLYLDLQRKLGLNDLVPKKRIAQTVKRSLKTDRFLRERARNAGTEKRPKIPGGHPASDAKKDGVVLVLVKAANKFWRKPSA